MKILLVNHRFHPAEGGTERWTWGLARALTSLGDSVQVLTQEEPNAATQEFLDGIHVHRLPMRHLGKFRVPRSYWRTLRSLDYDLLHMSGNRIWCADFYFPVAGIFDGPQVITPHDFYQLAMDPSWLNRAYFGRYFPLVLRAFDAYLALNAKEQERMIRFGFPPRRIHLVGEGVDLAEFRSPPGFRGFRERWGISTPLMALYVGGLWPNKRLDRVVRALVGHGPRVALVIVGRDIPGHASDRASVEAMARAHGVPVIFTGPLPRDEVLAAYHEADLYLQGSSYEAFGVSLVEACAAGLPFVAYDTGIARDLAGDGAGFVAAEEDEFRTAVARLIQDESLRLEVGRKARQASRRWDWDSVVPSYRKIYQDVLKGHGAAQHR